MLLFRVWERYVYSSLERKWIHKALRVGLHKKQKITVGEFIGTLTGGIENNV